MLIGLAVALIAAVWFSSKSLQSDSSSEPDRIPLQEDDIRYRESLPNSPNAEPSSRRQTVPDEVIIHTVQKNETLSEISQKYYGSIRYVSLIIENNEIQNPDEIKPGMRLKIPAEP